MTRNPGSFVYAPLGEAPVLGKRRAAGKTATDRQTRWF
jgi:hypothetical protein